MMIFIRRHLQLKLFLPAVLISGMLAAGVAVAAEDATTQAMKLYEKHHYEEAARLLRPELPHMDGGRQAAASLALGMIYLGNARLYRELYQTALVIELDYLTKLSRQKTGASSRYVDFYLGEALLEAGKPADAIVYLRRFAAQAGARSAMKADVGIELGIAYSRLKQAQKAGRAWSGLNTGQPEIRAALAGAYAVTGAQQHKPVAMADAAVNDAKTQHYVPGPRMIRNLLRAYSEGGASGKALDLLNANECKDASYVEGLGASKSISFYDLSVLHDMARVNLDAAILFLEQARPDAKAGNTAAYYLADAYLQAGNAELSQRAAKSFLSQPQLPPQYRDIAQAWQAGAQYLAGKRGEAAATWQALAEKSANDPALLAVVLQACSQAGADCAKLEKRAVAAVENGEGKKFFVLNAALGKYYLLQRDYPKAVLYMEAGRDKAYKNKIEVNDPLLLTGLAEAYYRNKKFSESLEIYFELGMQYPVVRQIQESMQGIYSMEQQSAGDVKIF